MARVSPLRIVGIGGTTKSASSTEHALVIALASAREAGAEVQHFDGPFLAKLPHYGTDEATRSTEGAELIAALRQADGVILASPGYHGSISGLVKNAVDYLEETARDQRVYLDGVPVGLIVTAYGWQATGSTLSTLRSIVHSLRGWPTPLGATINSSGGVFKNGECTDAGAAKQLELVGQQVVEFARIHRAHPEITDTGVD
jgi:FMN reductase